MNASPHHPKVKVSVRLSDPQYAAGGSIGGKLELECRADKGLALGVIRVELLGIEGASHIRPAAVLRPPLSIEGETVRAWDVIDH